MAFMLLRVSLADMYGVPLGARSCGKWRGSDYELSIVLVPEVLTVFVGDRLTNIQFQHYVAVAELKAQII